MMLHYTQDSEAYLRSFMAGESVCGRYLNTKRLTNKLHSTTCKGCRRSIAFDMDATIYMVAYPRRKDPRHEAA